MKASSSFAPDLFLKLLISISLVFFAWHVSAQERCATVEFQKKLVQEKGIPERENDFEKWLQNKTQQRLKKKGPGIQSTYQIPVVVHVIHNGESIGSGANISTAQILSQLSVLNKDFNRLNVDASETPDDFSALAGSMNIEFVLAKRTPAGLPTSGIVRVKGNKSSWNYGNDTQLKSLSYWPSEDYMNIWVCNLTDYLGYAQFPISDLPGLEEYQDEIAETDGVVFSYKVFGSIDDGIPNLDPQYNKGRTATHEIGHFFGLKHIWGDDFNCSGTDHVDDTPNQKIETYNDPVHPLSDVCSSAIMFQNYMDYSDDKVMNLFTKDQVERMVTVLESSPRRFSLLSSSGLLEPEPVGNDIAVIDVASPSFVSCNTSAVPRFTIENVGTTDISSFKISYRIDNGPVQIDEESYSHVDLKEDDQIEITMPPISLAPGTHHLELEIIDPNGFQDSIPENNVIDLTFAINTAQDRIPLRQQFEDDFDAAWTIVNPAGGMNWEITELSTTHALRFNAFSNVIPGDESWFVSPVLDLSNVTDTRMLFDLSYAYREDGEDQLKILASTDCGETYDKILFSKTGESFASGRVSSTSWAPLNDQQWSEESISLSSLEGNKDVRIAFVATNDNGNNVYIDNLEFFVSYPDNPVETNTLVSVYPNPAEDGEINVVLSLPERENASVEILDALGKTKFTTEIPDALNQTFPISMLTTSPGLYFLRFKTPTITQVIKFMVVE
ncbi:MAG TPA: M43 family zinc metalloprotease [Ohtaekwangia sp.]